MDRTFKYGTENANYVRRPWSFLRNGMSHKFPKKMSFAWFEAGAFALIWLLAGGGDAQQQPKIPSPTKMADKYVHIKMSVQRLTRNFQWYHSSVWCAHHSMRLLVSLTFNIFVNNGKVVRQQTRQPLNIKPFRWCFFFVHSACGVHVRVFVSFDWLMLRWSVIIIIRDGYDYCIWL